VNGVGAESAAQQRGSRFQHAIEGASPPDLGCLSIQRYGARCIRPLEAGAAVLVHRGFVRIALAEQAPFVDWMERVDKHVGATKRNPSRDASVAEPSDNVSFGGPSKAGFGQPRRQFVEEPLIHSVTIQKSAPRPGNFRIGDAA
jgi:hypothetical protein